MHQYAMSSTKVAAPEPLEYIDICAYPGEATTLESAATKTRADLPDNDNNVDRHCIFITGH